MEITEAFSSMQNGNSVNTLEKTTFFETDLPQAYTNGIHQFPNNGKAECKKRLRQRQQQQQEDRILFLHVPKKVIDYRYFVTAELQPVFKLLDADSDRKRKLPVRLPLARDEGSAMLADLESPVSQLSSLSECSSSTSEISENPVTTATFQEEVLCPDLDPNVIRPSEIQPPTLESPEDSAALETSGSLREETVVLNEETTSSFETRIAEQSGGEATVLRTPRPQSGSFCEEDKEFEFLKAARARRCSSLRISTSSGSLCKKKEVRFADVLGLDLVSVKQISASTEPPDVPLNVLRGLKLSDKPDDGSLDTIKQVLQLCPCFSPPGSEESFAKRVDEQKVVLDALTVDDVNPSVNGSICVANIAYIKSVFVRFTTNGWLSCSDAEATYLGASNGGRFDKFLFKIQLPSSFDFGNRLEFAICYESMGQVYWDNNFKENYRVECCYKQDS